MRQSTRITPGKWTRVRTTRTSPNPHPAVRTPCIYPPWLKEQKHPMDLGGGIQRAMLRQCMQGGTSRAWTSKRRMTFPGD